MPRNDDSSRFGKLYRIYFDNNTRCVVLSITLMLFDTSTNCVILISTQEHWIRTQVYWINMLHK